MHPEKYYDYVENLWISSKPNKEDVINVGDSYCCQHSFNAARLAVQAMKISIDNIFKGTWNNAFAAVRPPGHHAGIGNTVSGFCYFNNVAAAARYAQKTHGVKRVAILDWDAHHGNSTQQIFESDKSVLFISIHRHNNGQFYPGKSGALNNIGKGEGEGYNLNLPWNSDSDTDYKVDYSYIVA